MGGGGDAMVLALRKLSMRDVFRVGRASSALRRFFRDYDVWRSLVRVEFDSKNAMRAYADAVRPILGPDEEINWLWILAALQFTKDADKVAVFGPNVRTGPLTIRQFVLPRSWFYGQRVPPREQSVAIILMVEFGDRNPVAPPEPRVGPRIGRFYKYVGIEMEKSWSTATQNRVLYLFYKALARISLVGASAQEDAWYTMTSYHRPSVVRFIYLLLREGAAYLDYPQHGAPDRAILPIRCAVCDKKAQGMCGGCQERAYCGSECRKSDWETHKENCK